MFHPIPIESRHLKLPVDEKFPSAAVGEPVLIAFIAGGDSMLTGANLRIAYFDDEVFIMSLDSGPVLSIKIKGYGPVKGIVIGYLK